MPELIKNFTGGSESEAASYFALIASSYAVMQFIFAPFWAHSPTASAADHLALVTLGH
ncbi:MAG: hypothetical protein R2865_10970 [Deinococcales bacterium]